jgi:hypothetical protein
MKIKKFFLNETLFYTLLLFLILILTFLDTSNRDYTSVIDFDLTVIHNALQIISNAYPDYRDHTAYSQFFLYGIFYKLFSFFDNSLVVNIYLLSENKNPEVSLQKLYIISRFVNSIVIFLLIFFFNKILNIFNIKNNLIILSTFFLLTSESILLNYVILRADIIAVCFFLISFYCLNIFSKDFQIKYLFIFSFFMIFSLLAKVQIVFAFYFLIIFFIFYQFFENKYLNNSNLNNNNLLFKKLLKINFKFIIIIPIVFYFIFQFFINNYINSSAKIGYLDSFVFGFFFLIIYLILIFICKKSLILINYFYFVFSSIILFSFFPIFLLKIFSLLNFIQVDFNILFSTINPFYFLKSYSSFSGQQFSLDTASNMVMVFFSDFQFNLIYSLFLIFIYFVCILKFVTLTLNKNFSNTIYNNCIYIFLFCSFCFFLISINNFRYNPLYDIYIYPFFLIILFLYIKCINNKFRKFFIFTFIFFFTLNFYQHFQQIKSLFAVSSNHALICQTKSIRNFYFVWAKNFDESFFRKLCLNKELTFK